MTDDELDAMSVDELRVCFANTQSAIDALDAKYSNLLGLMQQIIAAKARKGMTDDRH